MYTSEYPIIGATVDIVVFSSDGQHVVLIERGDEPFKGKMALPGGFLNPDETLAQAAARELREETGIEVDYDYLNPMPAVYTPGRDPRGPVVSHPFWIRLLLREEKEMVPTAGDDAAKAEWVEMAGIIVPLAFDHSEILGNAITPMVYEKQKPFSALKKF